MAFQCNDIGNRLKTHRRLSNLCAEEIAKQLRISKNSIYRMEDIDSARISANRSSVSIYATSPFSNTPPDTNIFRTS